jgi:transcriptional regulator with XRE-family HTH domain
MYDYPGQDRRCRRFWKEDMPRLKKNTNRKFNAEALGQFVKSVREARGRNLSDVAREAGVNRQAAYNLESGGTGVPSIRTIEAICRQIDLDPLAAIGAGFGDTSGDAAGLSHILQETLSGLSVDDLAFVLDFVKLVRSRPRAATKEKRKSVVVTSRST